MRCVLALAVAAGGCFVQSPVVRFGGGKSAKEAQYDQASKLTPPVLVALDEGWEGNVSTATIRVWADDDFRAQNVHWRETFGEQLAYANEVLGPMLGLRLVAEYREWHHSLDAGVTLEDRLDELRKQDPGNDVLGVVGLTSALGLVSATFDHLGVASTPGRHIMLRGYANGQERVAFDRYFRELKPEEREALYRGRRRHKTTAVLLHELAHNLGVGHEVVPDTLMNPMYSDKAASFTPQARDIMLATIDARLGRKSIVRMSASAETHPTLVVTIGPAGQPSIGGNVVDDTTLDELLKMSFADDPQTQIVVKAPRGSPQGPVVKVLERAKAAGLTRMAISTAD